MEERPGGCSSCSGVSVPLGGGFRHQGWLDSRAEETEAHTHRERERERETKRGREWQSWRTRDDKMLVQQTRLILFQHGVISTLLIVRSCLPKGPYPDPRHSSTLLRLKCSTGRTPALNDEMQSALFNSRLKHGLKTDKTNKSLMEISKVCRRVKGKYLD